MSDQKLRVVSIAHTGVVRAFGRLRYQPFAGIDHLDVHLVVPQRWKQFGRELVADPPDDPGVTTHVLPIIFPSAGPLSWYMHLYPGLGRLIREVKPHVIHLWEEPWGLVALQACFLKGYAGLVLEVDQNILKRLPPPFQSIRRHVLGRTDHLLSRNQDATRVAETCGYRGPVSLIGYGVDSHVFKPVAEGPARDPQAPLTIGYVGRIIEEKGVQDALDAMARSRVPVHLKLMGEGPYEEALRQQASALGLSDRLTVQTWDKPEGVAAFIRTLDALLLLTHTTPKVKEQFGRVIIEAQGCGVPVIGAASGAIPDVIGPGGWVVPERDCQALAALFERLAGDPEERRQKALDGIENVHRRFTYEAVAGQLLDGWISAARGRYAGPLPSMGHQSHVGLAAGQGFEAETAPV